MKPEKSKKKSLRLKLPLIQIPSGVNLDILEYKVKLSGPKGNLEREFLNPRMKMDKENNVLSIKPTIRKVTKSDKMFINTTAAHIRNMIKGVEKGYECKLKVCSGHFPITVLLEGREITIKNFFGEKVPRKIKLFDGVNAKLDADIITLSGIDKEKLGSMGAKIERLTNVGKRDKRVFQDGCYIIKKPGEE